MPLSYASRSGRFHAAIAIAVLGAAASSTACTAAADSPRPPSWPPQIERTAATIFISGHSLTDRPIPDYIEEIARSLGSSIAWNRQYIVGSSIQTRTRGRPPAAAGWPGYRQGQNKTGEGMDVVAELRRPATTGGKRYDILLITEAHNLLGALQGGDSVRGLRHYHDLFVSANPEGQTYFYEPWLGILDKSAPQRWIDYEREASPVWQCFAARINLSLQQEGRKDRITPLPVGVAFADLVERATTGKGVPGITAGSVRETVDGLFADDVHLTPRGGYYAALVSYAAIYHRSPIGAWAPEGVDATQAASLQRIAWEFISGFYGRSRPLSPEECRSLVLDRFSGIYWNYIYENYRRTPRGVLESAMRYAKHLFEQRRDMARTTQTFTARDASNPFFFSPELDRSYWHAPPD